MTGFCNLSGQRFHRLTVIARAENNNRRRACWSCLCDCGNIIVVPGKNLRNSNTKSCGCLHQEILNAKRTTHGQSKKPVYASWTALKKRCTYPKDPAFKTYGERGITVCSRWLESFENFYEDMGDRPKGMTLDRIDNNSGYSKENCRWATPKEQSNNKSNNRFIEFDGQTQTLAEWARELGINRGSLVSRLGRGWPVEKALTTPVKRSH